MDMHCTPWFFSGTRWSTGHHQSFRFQKQGIYLDFSETEMGEAQTYICLHLVPVRL
jgi:hypothetical protein